ncbi:MAG: LegC family aminotransferase [Homoserinimonas sp.]
MRSSIAADFVSTVRHVVGDAAQVPLHIPDIGDAEKAFVADCLDSTFVSSVGPYVNRFESEIADYTGSRHAIAVSNGTSALQVALVLAGVEHGDEVIVPALSFVATANAVSHAGGHPFFVDSDPATMGMDVSALEYALRSFRREGTEIINPRSGRRVAAVIPMHTLGHPVDISALVALAESFGIPVVEDAAESLGSFIAGRHTGTFGRLGILSFNGNKIVTTGGGGMILTQDDEIARRAKHLTTTAKVAHAWEFDHDEIAWNYRMPNLNAAMGVAQLTKLEQFLVNKRELARRYAEAFATVPAFTFMTEPEGTSSNYWLCAVKLEAPSIELRNEVLQAATSDGLQCRPFWNLLNELRMYQSCDSGDLSAARALRDGVICLPSSPGILD